MGENAFISVLKITSFRNLWLSQVISQVVLNLLVFSLMIRIYEITESNTAVSVMILTIAIPNLVLGAVAGVLVDRSDRKIVMFLSHFLRVFAVLAFLLSSGTLAWLYVLSLLISFITQFFFPAEAAMIGVLVRDKRKLLVATSLFSLTLFSSVIVGNVLAGPSVRFLGIEGTFILVAVAFAVASFFTSRLPGRSIGEWLLSGEGFRFSTLAAVERGVETGSIFQGFLEGLDYLHRHKLVRRAIYLMVVAQIVVGTLGAIAPGFADRILGVAVSDVSLLIMAPVAVGVILGAIILGQFHSKSDKPKLVKFGMFSVAMVLVLFSFVDKDARLLHLPVIPLSVSMLVVLGVFNAFFDIPVNTLIQENTPEGVRSRVYGVLSTLTGGASILPILAAGAIADLLGVRAVMAVLGVALLGVGVYYRDKLTAREEYVVSAS